jgi:hypothetical protein
VAHVFDSGLPGPQRTLVRDAVVAALVDLLLPAMHASGKKYLTQIVGLPAAVKFGSDDEAFLRELINGQSPSVLVALGKRRFEADGTDNVEWRGELRVHVYVASSHSRGLVTGRLAADVVALADDHADPGVEVIGEHVFERLSGLPLDTARGSALRPDDEDLAYVGMDWTVLEQTYDVLLDTNVDPNRALTQKALDVFTTHKQPDVGDDADVEADTELAP